MMYGAELYRRLAAETGVDPSWHEVGSLRLASSRARFEELQRQAGWAQTFGLPLELISASEARDRFPLMSTDGVLGAVWLPTDGWLDPSGLAHGARGRRAAARGRPIRTHTRVVGIGVERGRVTGVEVELRDGSRETIAADVVVNAGGMFAPEIGRLAGVTIPIVPMAHQYLFTEAIDGVHAGPAPAPRPGQPRLLPRGGRRAVHGRLRAQPGAVVARRRPAGLQRQAARARLAAVRGDHGRRGPARARRSPTRASSRMINGPEGFTPDNEFILGEIGRPRVLRRRRVLRPRDRRRRRDRPAGGELDRRRRAGARPVEHGHPPVRRRSTGGRASGRSPGRPRSTRPTTTSTTRTRSARPAGRCGPRRRTSGSRPSARCSARSPAGSGPNWFEPNADDPRCGGRAALEARGRAAGPASTGARRSRPRRSRRGRPPRLFDETSFAKIEVVGPRRRRRSSSGCARTRSTSRSGAIVYTSLLNSRGGIESDLTVTRVAPDRFLLVTGTAFGKHDLGWLRKHLPADGSVAAQRHHVRPRLLRAVGPARPRHPRAAHDRRPLERGVPVPDRPGDHRRAGAGLRAAGHVRRRARLGAVRPRGVRRRALGHALGGRPASTASSPPATGRSTRSGSRRATGSGRSTSRPTRRRTRPAWGSPSRSTRRRSSSAATRSSRRRRPGRGSGCAASSSTTRGRSASATSRSGSAARIVGRVTSGGYGYAVERSIAYAYLPPDCADRDARRDRRLRRVGRLRGGARAALRPGRRADPRS